MLNTNSIYYLPAFFSAVLSAGIALHSWLHKDARGAVSLGWLMTATAGWSLAAGMMVISGSQAMVLFWTRVKFLCISIVPVIFLEFAIQYTGSQRRLTREHLAAFLLVPILTQIILWTNSTHHLFYDSVDISRQGNLFLIKQWQPGVWFWIHTGYSYALILLGLGVTASRGVTAPPPYRGQAISLLVGVLVSLAINVLNTFLPSFGWGNVMPLGLSLSGMIFAWGLYRYQLLDMVPVARDLLIESMIDGLIVIDSQGRIADINAAAREMIGVGPEPVIGKPASEVFEPWRRYADRFRNSPDLQTDVCIQQNGQPRHFSLRLSTLQDHRGRKAGRLILLRDISQRVWTEEHLRDSERKLRAFAKAIPDVVFIFDQQGKIVQHFDLKDHWSGRTNGGSPGDKSIQDILAPTLAQEFVKTIHKTIESQKPQWLEYSLDFLRETRWFEGRTAPIPTEEGQVDQVVWISRDITERKQAEQAAVKHARELSALNDATSYLLKTLDLEVLLQHIIQASTKAIPAAEKCVLRLISPGGKRLVTRAFHGYPDPEERAQSPIKLSGYLEKALKKRKPLILNNLHKADQIDEKTRPVSGSIRSAIVIPLVFEDQELGVLSVESSRWWAFTRDDMSLLTSFAATATVAIRNAQLHAEVQRLAETDSLTQLYNRRGLFELGRSALQRAKKRENPFSVIMLDVDEFKRINDSYGHATGDEVLSQVAHWVQAASRKTDIVGRYGGDELVLLLPDTDYSQAHRLAERILKRISGKPLQVGSGSLKVSLSVGIAQSEASNGSSLEELMKQADEALYAAKQNEGDKIVIH
jgi:diguanylate cyclase (GGDEF)-like protein/PAS domain S-box-containing protein